MNSPGFLSESVTPTDSISDGELDAIDNYDGATLTLQRNGGANAEYIFTSTGTVAPLIEGGSLEREQEVAI